MSELADRFMSTLQQLERERDVERLVQLFASDVELKRAPRSAIYRGHDGARSFWSEYLDAFQSIETQFGQLTESPERVVMEWHSVATTKQGRHIEYDGCSIIELAGDRVARFRTYYDAASAGMGGAVQPEAAQAARAS
jgi:ketosteroid isomerase-like protein